MDSKSVSLHLIEIRNRALRSALLFIIVFLSIYPMASNLFDIAAKPILMYLPEHSNLIATEVTSTFFIPLKLDFYLSLIITLPYIFYHIWAFVAPALSRHNKIKYIPLSIFSLLLFYVGFSVSYFVVLPILFKFFIGVSPASVQVMTDINSLLGFIIFTSLMVGFVCQIPIILVLIVSTGLVEISTLKKGRRFAILGAFIIAMIIAPDVLFQFVFALPIYIMYEIGLISASILKPKSTKLEILPNSQAL